MFNTVLEGLYASQRHFFSKEKQKNRIFFSPYFIENDSLNQIFKPQLSPDISYNIPILNRLSKDSNRVLFRFFLNCNTFLYDFAKCTFTTVKNPKNTFKMWKNSKQEQSKQETQQKLEVG